MKHLETTETGGFPFVLDDLRWMETGINDAINAFIRGFKNNSTQNWQIITGLDYDGFQVDDGWIFFNGEMCYCPGISDATLQSGEMLKFQLSEIYDPSGSKIFQNNVNNPIDTYLNRTVEIIKVPLNNVDTYRFDPQSTRNRLKNNIYDTIRSMTPFPSIVLHQSITNEVFNGEYSVISKENMFGDLLLRGKLWFQDIVGSTSPLFTININLHSVGESMYLMLPCIHSTSIAVLSFRQLSGHIDCVFDKFIGNDPYEDVISFDNVCLMK